MSRKTKGKLQFQSEGAEHFYKSIEIRPISFVQSNPKLVAKQKEIIINGERDQLRLKLPTKESPLKLLPRN